MGGRRRLRYGGGMMRNGTERSRGLWGAAPWLLPLALVTACGGDDSSRSGGQTATATAGNGTATAGTASGSTSQGSATGTAGGTTVATATASAGSDTGTAGSGTAGTTAGTATGGTAGGGTTGTTGAGSAGSGGTTGGMPGLPLWILAVEDRADDTHRLLRISVDPMDLGAITEICADLTFPPSIGQQTNVTSLTFNKSVLYASVRKNTYGDTLVIVDPCTCTTTEVGEYGYTAVNGITSNVAEDMRGVSADQDVILDIDPMSAMSSVLNNLPGDWGSNGLSWSDPMTNYLYGIDAASDRLYTFDGTDGSLVTSVDLSMNFGSVGIEYHPDLATLFTCSNPGDLWSVDIPTGTVTVEADLNLENCDNLAAPFGPVACIPQ